MPFTNEPDINLFPCEAISRPEKSESEGRDVNADCKVTLQPNLGSSCLPCCKISSVVTVLSRDDGDRHHHGEGQALPLSSAVSCLTSPPIAIILPGMSPCPAYPSSKPSSKPRKHNSLSTRLLFQKDFNENFPLSGNFLGRQHNNDLVMVAQVE